MTQCSIPASVPRCGLFISCCAAADRRRTTLCRSSVSAKRRRVIAPQEQTASATVGPSSGDEPMNSQLPRPGSSESSSARSHTPAPAQDMRAKAGEAASKISDAARQAGDQAKQAASSLASDATKQAKGLLNMQVTAGADMVDHVADSARAAAESLDQNAPQLAGLVRNAAERAEAFSQDLRDQTVEDLI